MIDSSAIDQIKDQIVAIISDRVELRPRGRKFYAICPFHNDHHPSFEVNPAKSAWFCNVCNLGGDAISFIGRFHQTDFRGALKILGVSEDRVPRQKIERYWRMKAALEKARGRELARIEERLAFNATLSRGTNLDFNDWPDSEFFQWEMARLYLEFNALVAERDFVMEVFRERMMELRGVLA